MKRLLTLRLLSHDEAGLFSIFSAVVLDLQGILREGTADAITLDQVAKFVAGAIDRTSEQWVTWLT